jgi:hypothetical protein
MSGIFGFVSVSLIFGISLAHASEVQSDTSRPNGQTGVDVTVRARPQSTAPAVKDLEIGTPLRTVPAKAPGWVHIVRPTTGWIPADTFSPEFPGEAPLRALGPSDPQEKPRRRHRRIVTGARGANSSDPSSETSDPSATAQGSVSQERSDSDLMLEALTAERGDTPNAGRIARVVAQTAMETKKNQEKEKSALPSLWKDPFVDDSVPPAVVKLRGRTRGTSAPAENDTTTVASLDRQPLDSRARREIARARAEAAAARTDAEVARAEAARVKEELARRAASGGGFAGKEGALAARAGCADSVAVPRRALVGRGAGWRDATLTEGGHTGGGARKPKEHFQALNATAPRAPRNAGASKPIAVAEAPSAEPPPFAPPTPPAPAPVASAQPTSASNDSWSRGILVVPITPLKRSH